MEFVVLARKLRPNRFADLIGQDTVVTALRNAILSDRVAHAFLFAGSRGVGKTSTARILTKALNCERPRDGEPCNECDNCREIALNTSPDVYEIDAASNRGIDNIRELRENTKYAPVKSRYKTYIIDEVHMLTTESFNALLKTLEEPPPHVKFVLATTNPHRIPETIISRCQRYDFARIPVAVLTDYLATVAGREGLGLSRRALETIARNASGGVRDALTAVDQVVSFAGAEADDAQVLSILGLTDNREVFALLAAILGKSLPDALAAFAAIRARGHDLGVLLEALLRELKDFSLWLSLEGDRTAFSEHPPDTLAFFAEWRDRVTLDELQQRFYLLLEVEQQLKRSEFAQACFEMGLVKACSVAPLVGVTELVAQVRALSEGRPLPEPAPRAAAPAPRQADAPRPERAPAATSAATFAEPSQALPQAPPSGAGRVVAALAQPRSREGGAPPPARGAGGGDRSAGEDDGEPRPADTADRPAAAASTVQAAPRPPAVPAAPAGHSSPRANGTAAPAGDGNPPLPADEGPALCDDPRWRGFVEALGTRHPRLAAKLRRAELVALTDAGAEIVAADAHNAPTAAELETAAPFVAAAFGAPFPIRGADDTRRKAREAHTIAGRNRIEEAARLAARRGQAEQDPDVQRVLRFFPKGRILDIALSDEPPAERGTAPSNRSDDV